MQTALSEGRFREALHIVNQLDRVWAASHLYRSYKRERAEALIGIGKPKEALQLMSKGRTA